MAVVYCPNCGSHVALPETSTLETGMTISRETEGIFALPLEQVNNNIINITRVNNGGNNNMNTRENRMAVLNNAGVDVSKYFDVTLPNGDVVKMTMGDNGIPVVVTDDDPILNQIIEDGYVRNTKLHRRWIMAQTFKALNYVSWDKRERGYDAYVRTYHPYKYQFTMMLEEVRVLSKLEERDVETFEERSHFFDKYVIVETIQDYILKLEAYLNSLPKYKCKGIPYIRVKGENIFVEDINKKLIVPVYNVMKEIKNCTNYKQMYRVLNKFTYKMINLPSNTKKSKVWMDAYKGSGATYTLYNLVKFHNCDIYDGNKIISGTEAVKYISQRITDYYGEYWRMMALLKKVIADNNFDFNARMKEIYNN